MTYDQLLRANLRKLIDALDHEAVCRACAALGYADQIRLGSTPTQLRNLLYTKLTLPIAHPVPQLVAEGHADDRPSS